MKVLFITYTRIGDSVLSTGLLDAILARHGNIRVTIACGRAAAPLFTEIPGLDRIIPMTKRRASRHWWPVWRRCVYHHWDLVVDLRDSAVSRLVRARERRILSGGQDRRHMVERLAGVLGLDPPPAPRLWIGERHEDEARKHMPGLGQVLAIGPTANWIGKQWPVLRFAELVRRLTEAGAPLAGARVAVLGGPGEREAAAPLLRMIPGGRRLDLVGRLDLLTAAALLRRVSLYIGNDSGLMHIAAAAGAPTLGLFGPSRENNYAPWGDKCAVVRTAKSYDQLVGGPGYDHRTTASLMDSLSIDAVETAANGLWRRVTEPAA